MGNYTSDPADHQRSPFDLRWDRIVNFNHDYIGKEALKSIAAEHPRQFVTLEWNSEDVVDVFASLFREESYDYMEMPRVAASAADWVYINGNKVGCALSRCYSYSFKKMLSHCIIDSKYSPPGTEVVVKWGGKNSPQKDIRAVCVLFVLFLHFALLTQLSSSATHHTRMISAGQRFYRASLTSLCSNVHTALHLKIECINRHVNSSHI
jgi:glycine cleavage system aminomethyltransferase T